MLLSPAEHEQQPPCWTIDSPFLRRLPMLETTHRRWTKRVRYILGVGLLGPVKVGLGIHLWFLKKHVRTKESTTVQTKEQCVRIICFLPVGDVVAPTRNEVRVRNRPFRSLRRAFSGGEKPNETVVHPLVILVCAVGLLSLSSSSVEIDRCRTGRSWNARPSRLRAPQLKFHSIRNQATMRTVRSGPVRPSIRGSSRMILRSENKSRKQLFLLLRRVKVTTLSIAKRPLSRFRRHSRKQYRMGPFESRPNRLDWIGRPLDQSLIKTPQSIRFLVSGTDLPGHTNTRTLVVLAR